MSRVRQRRPGDRAGEPTTTMTAEELIARGYRRTSNAYALVTRIDRPDWLNFMAKKMRCSEGRFLQLSETAPPQVDGRWASHYRGVYSEDEHTVDSERLRKIPSSGHDPVGYIHPITLQDLSLMTTYKTQAGDSVAGIALRQLKDESRWKEIADLNSEHHPDMLPPDYYPVGTTLILPERA